MLDSRGLLGSFKWLGFFSSKSTVMVWLLFTHPSVLLTYPWVFYPFLCKRSNSNSPSLILLIVVRCLFVFDKFADR